MLDSWMVKKYLKNCSVGAGGIEAHDRNITAGGGAASTEGKSICLLPRPMDVLVAECKRLHGHGTFDDVRGKGA